MGRQAKQVVLTGWVWADGGAWGALGLCCVLGYFWCPFLIIPSELPHPCFGPFRCIPCIECHRIKTMFNNSQRTPFYTYDIPHQLRSLLTMTISGETLDLTTSQKKKSCKNKFFWLVNISVRFYVLKNALNIARFNRYFIKVRLTVKNFLGICSNNPGESDDGLDLRRQKREINGR